MISYADMQINLHDFLNDVHTLDFPVLGEYVNSVAV